MHTYAKISHTHVEDPVVHVHLSEFGGLWKHQINPACAKSVRLFIMLKLDTIWKKKIVTAAAAFATQYYQGSHSLHNFV